LVKSDASLNAQVTAGEISETEAIQIKGDRIWWRAFEETRGASLYMAVGVILERDLTAYFKDEPVKAGDGFDEIQNEIEVELTTKLRQCLGVVEA